MAKKTAENTNNNNFTDLFEDVLKTNPQQMLVVSLDDKGRIHFNTNMPNYPFIHYILNKATFEVHLHERNAQMMKEEEKAA